MNKHNLTFISSFNVKLRLASLNISFVSEFETLKIGVKPNALMFTSVLDKNKNVSIKSYYLLRSAKVNLTRNMQQGAIA